MAMKRLFFALWPDNRVRARLVQQARRLSINSGQPVPPENFHITLVFLGNVEEQAIPTLAGAAEGLRIPDFPLQLDHCGWWKRMKCAWLAPASTPEPLLELVKQLNRLSRMTGLSIEERDYRPHVTLARKLTRPLMARTFEPIYWDVREFYLVESVTYETGARYRPLQRWPLCSRGPHSPPSADDMPV